MGSLLKGVSGVRWGELRDARQLPAGDIPPLLSRIAYGGEDAARLAVDELGDSVCALGFVVGEATAPTVPFLLELAGAPYVPCKAELLDLLESIYRTDNWHSSAAAAGGPKRTSFREQPAWEAAARKAVHAAAADDGRDATVPGPLRGRACLRSGPIRGHHSPPGLRKCHHLGQTD